jgi:hypothetical protein
MLHQLRPYQLRQRGAPLLCVPCLIRVNDAARNSSHE